MGHWCDHSTSSACGSCGALHGRSKSWKEMTSRVAQTRTAVSMDLAASIQDLLLRSAHACLMVGAAFIKIAMEQHVKQRRTPVGKDCKMIRVSPDFLVIAIGQLLTHESCA